MHKSVRFFSVVALTALGLTSSALHAAPLADSDPSREWRGIEYADMLYSKFRAQNPNVETVVDEKDIMLFFDTDEREKFVGRTGGLQYQTLENGKALAGKNIKALLESLESGRVIQLNSDFTLEKTLASQLRDWILAQPMNSIGPDELMIESLRLSHGHVIAAWATAWNATRVDWPYAQARNYSDITLHFKSVTGERDLWKGAARYIVRENLPTKPIEVSTFHAEGAGSSYGKQIPLMQQMISKRGDDFSTLYHHIGVELFALIMSNRTNSSVAGEFAAWTGAIGEYANFRKTAGLPLESRKRLVNDLQAGRSGARLFDLFKSRSKPRANILGLGTDYYLRANNLLFGKGYQLPTSDGRPSAYFQRDIDPKYWAKAMSQDELLLRFNHAAVYDSEIITDIVVSAGNGDSERLHLGLQAYIDAGLPNPILNQLILDFESDKIVLPNPRDVIVDFDSGERSSQALLGKEFGDFSFREAAVRQQRMIDKTQTAIRMKIEAAGGFVPEKTSIRLLNCRDAFLSIN